MSETLPSPGADAIAASLREQILADYPALRDAVALASRAVIAAREAADLFAVLRTADALSLAAEAVADAARALHEAADKALLAALLDAGAPALRCNDHTLGTRQNAPTVEVTDRRAVPEAFLVPAEPKLDLPAIRRHLKDHPETNWARLHDGSLSLTRKADR